MTRLGIDILGNIVILKFDRNEKVSEKKKIALGFLKEYPNVTTVLEKVGKFSGRLRKHETKWIAGEKTKEALYKENGCLFRFNVDSCYFSPRLSAERQKIASFVKKNEKVLVMFGGAAPFAIVISKNSKAKEVYSVELNRECTKYAEINVKRNKLSNVHIVQGDVRKVIGKGKKLEEKFDRIVMTRPQLKDSFLDVAFPAVKKNGVIHYYGFYEESKFEELRELIELEAKKAKKKIKIMKIEKAGDIGPYRFRYRADIRVMN